MSKSINSLSPSDRSRLEALVTEIKRRRYRERCQNDFLSFVKHMWPEFINGRHHARIAHEFEQLELHENGRLIINLGPRHTKSEFASVLLPAWYLGKHPDHKVIQCSVTAELAVGFGRRVRNMIDTDRYREIFPTVSLQIDSKAAGRWATNLGGQYFAIGVSGSVTGIGANLCVIPESSIITRRGTIQAQEVRLGDELLGLSGWNTVLKIISSSHSETVVLNGKLEVSVEHPVYIVEKGWTPAKDIKETDKLLVVSSIGILRVLYNQYRTYINDTAQSVFHKRPKIRRKVGCVQHLGDDAPTLLQPQRSQLSPLWRARHYCVRALEKFKEFYRRYGPKTLKRTHFGQDRWRGPLYAGELPMGGWRDTGQQPCQQYDDNCFWADFDDQSMGTQDRADARYDSSPDRQYGNDAGAGVFRRTDELESARGHSDGFDGQRGPAFQNISRNSKSLWRRGVERCIRACKNSLWVHMEVCSITREAHEPREFINFHVSGDNTFVCESSMVHNCIIDDPHDEQQSLQAITNPEIYDRIYDWYTSGPRQRLQPGGNLCVVMTRWSKRDLTAQLLQKSATTEGEKWKLIAFPAILPSGKPLWPEFWSLSALLATKEAIAVQKWSAQYMQNPVSEEGAIVKRSDWQRWPHDKPPAIDFVLQTMDTAFEKTQRADYSAITTWGVFQIDDDTGVSQANIILLDAVRERCEFPRLKQLAKEKYVEYAADKLIIEKRGSGGPLLYEFRAAGIPCGEYIPSRATGDKTARLHAVTDMFASKRVWAPNRRFADELIEEVSSFPQGDHDDYVDCTSMALAYFRSGGFIKSAMDLGDEPKYFKSSRHKGYY